MTKHDPRDSRPRAGRAISERGEAALDRTEKARLAEALRQNLRKRKEQSRARVTGAALREDAAAGLPNKGEDGETP